MVVMGERFARLTGGRPLQQKKGRRACHRNTATCLETGLFLSTRQTRNASLASLIGRYYNG
jgi:hypothetical protein